MNVSAAEIAEQTAGKLGLTNQGRESFIELCKQGCEPSFLAEHFYVLTHNSTITVTPKRKRGKSYQASLRPMDSVEFALGGFEKRQIEALQKRIKEVVVDIGKLNSCPLIRYIDAEDLEPYVPIFRLLPQLKYYADNFIPFLLEKYKKIGPKQRPHFNLYLNSICKHVKKETKKQQYRLICDVLNELGIDWDVDSLKQWYSRHKSGVSETI